MTLKGTLNTGLQFAAGSVLHLTAAQASARKHLLAPLTAWHKDQADKAVLPFRAIDAVYFKAGESIGVDGQIDRVVQNALGLSDDDVAAADKPVKGKRGKKADPEAQARADAAAKFQAIRAADLALATAQKAADDAKASLDAADADGKAAAQAHLDTTLAALEAAQAERTKLGD